MDPAQAPQVPGTGKTKNHHRILFAEDDDSLALIYSTLLEAEGFDVARVSDGVGIVAIAQDYKPDLVILDVMMPKASGLEALEALRKTPETASVKVVILTALSQDTDKQQAVSLGVQEYIVKSQVSAEDIVKRISNHLSA